MALSFTARVPAKLEHRDVVGEMLRVACQHLEREKKCAGLEWRVLSAFNEAFNNVAEHSYAKDALGQVSIVVHEEPARLVLEVQDDGPGFDYQALSREPLAPVDGLDDGGMGIFIIQRAVSTVTYTRGAPNRLTMTMNYADCRALNSAEPGPNGEESRC